MSSRVEIPVARGIHGGGSSPRVILGEGLDDDPYGSVDEHAAPEQGRPDTSPVEGVRPELLAALVLRRALRGGVAQAGPIYVDYGYRREQP